MLSYYRHFRRFRIFDSLPDYFCHCRRHFRHAAIRHSDAAAVLPSPLLRHAAAYLFFHYFATRCLFAFLRLSFRRLFFCRLFRRHCRRHATLPIFAGFDFSPPLSSTLMPLFFMLSSSPPTRYFHFRHCRLPFCCRFRYAHRFHFSLYIISPFTLMPFSLLLIFRPPAVFAARRLPPPCCRFRAPCRRCFAAAAFAHFR